MFKCDICNKDFTLKKNLKRHLKNIHKLIVKHYINKNARHKCPKCEHSFVERSSLRRHERLKHKIEITPSLRKRKPAKYVTFEPCNLEDYPLLKKLLPNDYIYKIIDIENIELNKFKVKFEIADCPEDMFFTWLSELEKKSKTTYRVKSFTKSLSPKIAFNKVFRCIHNTFPSKHSIPHPMHTGCPATLSVRIQKCVEALSLKSTIADNNVILIPLKAIVTLYHCHNHISFGSERIKYICSTENEEEEDINKTKKSLNEVHTVTFYSPDLTLCTSKLLNEKNNNDNNNTTEIFEEAIIPCEPENNTFLLNNNSQINMSTENTNLDLSEEFEEFDNFIFVEYVNTEHSLYNDDNETEIHQLLSDYENVNDRMLQQFKSNPKYFLSAIKTYTLSMKNCLASKAALLNALSSFGKLQEQE